VEALAEFDGWANQNPGTERQAIYAPEDYEKFREGVRNDIRDNARQDMATYGTGSDDQLKDAIERGNRTAGEQYKKRQERKASEERVRNAQRGRFYEERLRADAGLAPQSLGPNPTIDQLERAAYTQRYTKRQRELEARKQNRIDQAMMAGGQPTGGPFGTRATTTAINQLGDGWREIALLDRLTNGRVGGPTPLGVDAMGAQNALRFLNNEAIAGMDPLRRAQAQAQLDMQRRQNMPDLAGQQDVAMGNMQTPEAVSHLDDLADRHDTTYLGFSYENEAALAETLQRPPYSMTKPEAEAAAYRLAQARRWTSGRAPGADASDDPPPPESGAMPPMSL
jgi:hypothetical protein